MTDRLQIKPGRYSVVPWRAADDERLTRSDLRMLMQFGRRVDGAGFVILSQMKLAEDWGVTRQAVSKIVTRLIKFGYLRRHEQRAGTRGVWMYELISDAVYEVLEGDIRQPSEVDSEDEEQNERQPSEVVTTSTLEVDTSCGEERECKPSEVDTNSGAAGQCQPPEVAQVSTIAVDQKAPCIPPCSSSESRRIGSAAQPVENPPPDLGSFQLAMRSPRFEQAALAFIASKGADTWRAWFGSAGLTGADPPCLEVESEFVASHLRTHFIDFFEARCGQKIIIKVNQARRARRARQERGGRHAAR